MFDKLKKILVLPLVSLFLLSGCDTKTTTSSVGLSSSGSGGDTTVNYYNDANFVQSTKEINQTEVVLYDGPSLLETSSKVDIKVEDKDVFVYETRVNHKREFTYEYSTDTAPLAIFDFQGHIKVEIVVKEEVTVTSATVSPLVYGIEPVINNNVITFYLDYPSNYTVEYNGDYKSAIHLFANPLEEDPITKEEADLDDDIIYFGPGVYKTDGIPVKDGQTVYFAGGSVVYGQMITDEVKNLTIRGRGILSGAIYDRKTQDQLYIPLEFRNSENIKIEGITVLDPAGWTVAIKKSKDVTIDNLHIISARANSDGISVQSSENVTVTNSFVRSWDDSLVVKNVERGTTSNITFDGNIVWTDLAQSMEVGYETYGATMDKITFKNTTVVHNFHKPVISLHNCDDAHITNVSYENITLEDGQMLGDVQDDGENDFFIDFTIAYNAEWTKSEGVRGSVEGVTIKNVNVYEMASSVQSRMLGESSTSNFNDITISNIVIKGNKVSNDTDLKLTKNEFVSAIKYENSVATVGAIITLPYKIGTIAVESDVTVVPNITQDGVIVPENYYIEGLSYLGVMTNRQNYVATATHGVGTTNNSPYDDGSGDFSNVGHPASNLLDGDKNTTWSAKNWTDEANDFVALNINLQSLTNVGVIRLYAKEGNNLYQTLNFSLFGRKNKLDGTLNDKFVRVLSSAEYAMTPGAGNAIDIKFTATEYIELQIRFFDVGGLTGAKQLEFSEIEFYPPSLTYNKPIVDSSAHADVYPVDKVVDGDITGTSYYESDGFPAVIVIDMQELVNMKCIVLNLPPMTSWPSRTQEVELLYSDSNLAYNKNTTTFTTLVANKAYLFDPLTNGNMAVINLDKAVQARYLKVVITSNDVVGGYGAQLSEISVYGE